MSSSEPAPAPTCRNCGGPAPGAYCPACGQETRERLPTLREFVREAAGRYVALDGTLWRTLGALLFRPGFLTREYLAGRRRRYVRPLRLYLAASLVCFLAIGFTLDGPVFVIDGTAADAVKSATGVPAKAAPERSPTTADARSDTEDLRVVIDDVLVQLPEPIQPAARVLKQRIVRFKEFPRAEQLDRMATGMRHNAPYAMFALVPAFALLLKLMFPRRRRRDEREGGPRLLHRPWLYGEHLVFAVHNHAFLFVVATLIAFLPQPFIGLAWLGSCAYLVLSLRNVYGGGWLGTLLCAVVLFVLYVPVVSLGVVGLVIAAILLG